MQLCIKSRKGVANVSVAEAINLMISFGIFIISFIGLIITLIVAITKDNKK